MKPYHLTTQFYIIFILITLIPALWLAQTLQKFLQVYLIQYLPENILVINLPLFIEAPATIALIGLFFWWYETTLWKWPPFSYIHNIPNVNGRFEGEIWSSFDTAKRFGIVFEIEQTLTHINFIAYTDIESSYSIVAIIGKNSMNCWTILNVYHTEADGMKKPDLKSHEGVALTDIFSGGETLRGTYFSNPRDRGHYGTYELKRVGKKLLQRF